MHTFAPVDDMATLACVLWLLVVGLGLVRGGATPKSSEVLSLPLMGSFGWCSFTVGRSLITVLPDRHAPKCFFVN